MNMNYVKVLKKKNRKIIKNIEITLKYLLTDQAISFIWLMFSLPNDSSGREIELKKIVNGLLIISNLKIFNLKHFFGLKAGIRLIIFFIKK